MARDKYFFTEPVPMQVILRDGCCAQRRRDAGPSGTAEKMTAADTGLAVEY